MWLGGRRLARSAAVTHGRGGAALRSAAATSVQLLLGTAQRFVELCQPAVMKESSEDEGVFRRHAWLLPGLGFTLPELTSYPWVLFSFPASLLHLPVAAAGLPSPGRGPLPGLRPLLDPGLHHPRFQDERADLGRGSSPAPRGRRCVRLPTEEGRIRPRR